MADPSVYFYCTQMSFLDELRSDGNDFGMTDSRSDPADVEIVQSLPKEPEAQQVVEAVNAFQVMCVSLSQVSAFNIYIQHSKTGSIVNTTTAHARLHRMRTHTHTAFITWRCIKITQDGVVQV